MWKGCIAALNFSYTFTSFRGSAAKKSTYQIENLHAQLKQYPTHQEISTSSAKYVHSLAAKYLHLHAIKYLRRQKYLHMHAQWTKIYITIKNLLHVHHIYKYTFWKKIHFQYTFYTLLKIGLGWYFNKCPIEYTLWHFFIWGDIFIFSK